MELQKIIELMSEPEKLVDPRVCNVMSGYLNGFITEKEEQLNEENFAVSVKWAELRKELPSAAEADRQIELTDTYRAREKTKLIIGKLRRYRADLRSRFEVLMRYK